jgi:hypothetical protein
MLTKQALAPTTFTAAPTEELAAPDVYEIKSASVINKLPLPKSLSVESLTSELRGGKSMLTDLPSLSSLKTEVAGAWKVVGTVKGAIATAKGIADTAKQYGSVFQKAVGGVQGIKALASMSGPSLLGRIAGGTLNGVPGLAGTSIASLSTMLSNNVMPQQVKELFNTPIPAVLGTYGTVGGALTKILPSKITQSYEMTSMINNVMGTNQIGIVDKDSTARLLAGLSMGGIAGGIDNAFSSLKSLAGGDAAIEMSAAMSAISYSAQSGNIKSLKDVVSAIGPSKLASIAKSTIKNISTNYNPSSEGPVSDTERQKDFLGMISSFSDLDKNWLTQDRMKLDPLTGASIFDFKVTDATFASEGSPDMRRTVTMGAIRSDDPELKCLAAISMFPALSPEEELRKSFPMTNTSITGNTTASNNTVTGKQRNPLNDITIDGKYGDWRDDVMIDGVSNNTQSDTVVKQLGGS